MTRITGRCLCGGIQYEYDGEIGPAGVCHCEDCRRTSGSAFGISVRLEKTGFYVQKGNLGSYTKLGDSGNELTRHFCADCGSPIFTSSPVHRDFVYVKAGSLNDPDIVRLRHQAWTASAVAWARVPLDLPAFEEGRK